MLAYDWPTYVCRQPVECFPGCPVVLRTSWEVFVSTGVQGHDDVDDVDVDDDDDDFPICHLQFIVAYCVNRYRPVDSCSITTS